MVLLYKIVYTLSKGQFSIFVTWTDLGSKKHQTQAEIDDAVRVIKQCINDYGGDIASLAVDNAARGVARQVCERFPGMCIMMLRDPGHCVDLLAKDLLKTDAFKAVVDEAREVRELLANDRIDSIRHESIQGGDVEFVGATVSMVDTRMNMGHDFILAARRQHDFLQLLKGNPKFREYRSERTTTARANLDATLERCKDESRWERMDLVTDHITGPLKRVHAIVCRSDVPLSAYPALIQALRNELNRGLNIGERGDFDKLLVDGAGEEIAGMLCVRFNMDGRQPAGQKVGLLDRYHWMCLIVDPFSGELRNKLHIEDLARIVREMIELYIPLDEDGTETTRKEVKRDFLVSQCTCTIVPTFAWNCHL